VPLTSEICDGEDNNGDGFIDEGLYHNFPARPVAVPGGGSPVIASNGQSYLAAWPRGGTNRLSYLLLDGQGTPRGGLTQVPQAPAVTQRVAVGSSPSGFLLAFAVPTEASTSSIRLVRIDAQGQAAAPEILGTTTSTMSVQNLAVGWSEGGPVVVAMTSACQAGSCTGAAIYRPGQAVERIEGVPEGYPTITVAIGAERIAVGWVEYPNPSGTDGGTGARTHLRIVGGGTTASATIADAEGLALAWSGGDLLATWRDLQIPRQGRTAVRRFDSQARPVGLLQSLPNPQGFSYVTALAQAGREIGLLFMGLPSGQVVAEFLLTRVDPESGYIGAPVEFQAPGSGQTTASLHFTGTSFDVWATADDIAQLDSVRCSNTPPPSADAGAPFVPDGGLAPDGGSGPPGPPCTVTDADGGVTVEGSLHWLGGAPAPGLTVVLGACRAQSDSQGRFRATGIPPVYDLSVLTDVGGEPTALSFLEAATSTPTIELPYSRAENIQSAELVMTYPGGQPGDTASLHIVSPGAEYLIEDLPLGLSRLAVHWFGVSPTVAQAFFFEQGATGDFRRAQLLPDLALSQGAVLDLGTLAPAAVGSIAVQAHLPPAQFAQVGTILEFGTTCMQIEPGDATYHARAPVFDASFPASVHLMAAFYFSDSSSARVTSPPLTPTTTDVTFDRPQVPSLEAPPPGQTSAGQTPELRFSQLAGARYYFARLSQTEEPRVSYRIFGAAPPLRVPDLRPFGFALSAGAEIKWSIAALVGPPTSAAYGDLLRGARIFLGMEMLPSGHALLESVLATFNP
jgi:hypothetical protein